MFTKNISCSQITPKKYVRRTQKFVICIETSATCSLFFQIKKTPVIEVRLFHEACIFRGLGYFWIFFKDSKFNIFVTSTREVLFQLKFSTFIAVIYAMTGHTAGHICRKAIDTPTIHIFFFKLNVSTRIYKIKHNHCVNYIIIHYIL